MRRSLLLSTLALSSAAAAWGASFNCAAAHTAREHAICSSNKLSAADEELAKAYAAARAELSPTNATLVQEDQRNWLAWLDKVCPAKGADDDLPGCLQQHYESRLQQFTQGQQRIDGLLFFTRAHFSFVAGKPPAKTSDASFNDPGFGYGEFSWPQIDRPDNDHTLWNTAVEAAAFKIEGGPKVTRTSDLDAVVSTDGNQSGDYTLFAVNGRLIGVDFESSGYEWGAAHGHTDETSFNWWVDQRRPVVASDVFNAASGWSSKLVPLTIAGLRAGESGDALWKGTELTNAVTEGVRKIASWDLSSEGLTISFGEYQVAPYASGLPSVTLPWKRLDSLLTPNLRPELLPRRLKAAAH